MAADATYLIHVHPVDVSASSVVESVRCTKRTTAAEVVEEVIEKLGVENGSSYVLVEMHKDRGEEMILAHSDFPVQRMLLWPTHFQHSYKFVLREIDETGSVMYHGANSWHEKAERVSTERDMASKGFLPPTKPSDSDCPDLCALSSLTQEKLLEVLRKRFMKDKIYTYSADTLISINPYKFLPVYNPKYMTIYQNRRKEDLEPHIYAIADTAFNTMVRTKQNQCVVITGKSGSGKTQATHFLVHHSLALCQKSYVTGVENMLTGAGPVLEAFGNAQTEHNNNSSRFGKFLKIYFYGSGLLSGADVQTYLLEKSRLIHQEPYERNFHIFYYLLYGTSPEELSELYLDQNASYNYLKQCSKQENPDAPAELERLRQAMEVMGFYGGAQRSIFRLIAAIVLLGNITFRTKSGRDETLEIVDESYLTSVSSLLELDENVVRKCLLTRKAKAGAGERFILALKLHEARATRDAMAKALYQSLFDWAVSSVNMALAQKTRDIKLRSQSQWLGLLDIFGFEDFAKNSFEQFCINYASEHLQHYCIKHTFQLEQEEYRAEGLTWKEVDYADNSGCLLLYEKKLTGLFHLTDENFPGANNHTLLSNFNRVHSGSRYYETTVVKEDAFIIQHYAGKVKYQIKDFREKNHDQVREDLINLVRTTNSSFLQGILSKSPAAVVRWGVLRATVRATYAFRNAGKGKLAPLTPHTVTDRWLGKQVETEEKMNQAAYVHRKMLARLSLQQTSVSSSSSGSESSREGSFYGRRKVNATSRGRKKTNSITQQYQASLGSLMATLEKAHPFFVRCIQPNSKKAALKLDDKLVLHQLRCSGLLQTIQLHQSRYPERMSLEKFSSQFKLLMPHQEITLSGISNFLISIGLKPGKHFQTGRTQLFLRDHASRILKESLHEVVLKHVVLLQSRIRGCICRRSYLQQRSAAIKIQSYWRMLEAQREIVEWHLAASIIQDAWRCYLAQKFEGLMVQFQACIRGYLVRRRVQDARRKRVEEEDDQSARIIQRSWKNYRSKKRSNAAVIIQRIYRGHQARTLYKNMQEIKENEKGAQVDVKEILKTKTETSQDPTKPASVEKEKSTKSTPTFNDTNNNHEPCCQEPKPQPDEPPTGPRPQFRPRTKAGEVFLQAAYPKSKIEVVKPVVYVPSSKRKSTDEVLDGWSKSYDLKKSNKSPEPGRFQYTAPASKSKPPPEEKNEKLGKNEDFSKSVKPSKNKRFLKHGQISTNKDLAVGENLSSSLVNNTVSVEADAKKSNEVLKLDDIEINTDKTDKNYMETTFPAKVEPQRKQSKELARLEKEWLAFQRVEQQRQLIDLNRSQDGVRRRNKQDQRIRDEITSLRLEQMNKLSQQLKTFGVGAESMPMLETTPFSRNPSNTSDSSTPPQSPLKLESDAQHILPDKPMMPSKSLVPTKTVLQNATEAQSKPVVPDNKSDSTSKPTEVSEPAQKENGLATQNPTNPVFARSLSMESVAKEMPRRQRSNSAIEAYVASKLQPPSTDPVARKSASLSAEAFAKKCMHDQGETTHVEHGQDLDQPELQNQVDGVKRGSAFIEAMRKTFWGSSRGQNRSHPYLAEKKSTDSVISAHGGSSEKLHHPEDHAVNIKSLEEEQFSPKLLVSSADELLLLDDFIKSKTSNFKGDNLVDQVFKISLNEFCANLTALYSLTTLSGDTNGLRYKDIVANFRQVLEKTANHYSLDQYAAMMGVNGFRGYMNEFMNDVRPKYTKETKSKRKKIKDDSVEKLGHSFAGVQWGITQVCEFCGNTMWLMEAGLVCKICKFACHKKCFKQLTTRCPGSMEGGRQKSRPKKLFGESLASLASKDGLVPTFIDKCISYMEMNGIYQEGIYRKSAAATQNKLLEESLNKDIECQKVNFDDYNIHSVASCFKKFLRSLPSPLVPYDKYFEFLQSARLKNDRERVNALYHVLEGIPQQNHATLERIVFHLARVAQQEPTNRMSPSNLAIVFTPCFFAAPTHVSPIEAAEHVGDMTKAVECVITEQVKKVRSTLESISELQSVESSTNERLKQIRQSMGKGKKRRESLTNRLPALTPQLPDDNHHFLNEDITFTYPAIVKNIHLRHLNKHRAMTPHSRRRPTKYSSSLYSKKAMAPVPEEVKPPPRRVSAKGKFKRLASAVQLQDDKDSFTRSSLIRNPIHRPHKKRGNAADLLASKASQLSKVTSV
uniref:unconventional myosin-IXa isoform X2 n=1 Tax=Ciona intestinalis TaxID=7719 RepID=UPI00089DCBE2|nr:unconventional myosin-IXa isoform X2 [Ciona intestinalis]|eukprot:XP_018671672.1 unconventional myosin-IXa isoform X2 [Ciona intestinalis]